MVRPPFIAGPKAPFLSHSPTEFHGLQSLHASGLGRLRVRVWRFANVGLMLSLIGVLMGCNAGPTPEFVITQITATPNLLLQTDLITVDAMIHNTGSSATGNFEVRAFLKRGTDCNNTSFFLGAQTISIGGNGKTPFQVSRVIDNVTAVGTYYLCIHVDALDEVVERDETNNLIGSTHYPVHVVNCLSDSQCDDGNPCTEDTCTALVGCGFASNAVPCDDGLFCTVNDVCNGGRCQSGTERECADPNLCDGTMLCNEQASTCTNGEPPPSCDDGDLCNGVESCDPASGVCLAGSATVCDHIINNALAPPVAINVIDDASYDAASQQILYVRNLGCPSFGAPNSFCPGTGPPTTVEVASGALVGDVSVFDSSRLFVTGGSVAELTSSQSASVVLGGGSIEHGICVGPTSINAGAHHFIRLEGDSTVLGGTIQELELDSIFANVGASLMGGEVTTLFAGSGSSIRGGKVSVLCAPESPSFIYGTGFDVNGGAFGALPGSTGFVSGKLETGDVLNATYHQTGSWCFHPEYGAFDTHGTFYLLPPESTFIANGLTRADLLNVIDANDPSTQYHDVFVRNAGCPDGWPNALREAACASPGSATAVEVHAGASIPGTFWVRDSSTAIIRGGQVAQLRQAAATYVEVWGESFLVDGFAVPFGEINATSGTLTGTLASGEQFSTAFDREDPDAAGSYGTLYMRSAADLAAGAGVMRSLFGGVGTIGGVSVDLDIETGGTLSGSYELVPFAAMNQHVPAFNGLTIKAQTVQTQYQIWQLEFTGDLNTSGTSRITFTYDPLIVDPGKDLLVYGWDGSQWVRLNNNVVIDTNNHTISMNIDSFTIFAMIVRTFLAPSLSLGGALALFAGLAGTGILARRTRAAEEES
jgi:hypothetical protein